MILIRLTDTKKYLEVMKHYRTINQPTLLIGTTTEFTVYNTNKNDINFEVCEELNAVMVTYGSNGGAAVSNIGDLGFYLGIPGNHTGWCKYILQSLRFYFNTLGIKATIENNDLVIYGQKVLGYTETATDLYTTGAVFIAMVNSTEYVEKICLKPKTRKCGGLYDYGITNNEVIDIVIKATKKYLIDIGVEKGGEQC